MAKNKTGWQGARIKLGLMGNERSSFILLIARNIFFLSEKMFLNSSMDPHCKIETLDSEHYNNKTDSSTLNWKSEQKKKDCR